MDGTLAQAVELVPWRALPKHLAVPGACDTPGVPALMTHPLPAVVLILAARLLLESRPAPAQTLTAGGGPARSDCQGGWLAPAPNAGKIGIDCQDGDPACDVDRLVNGVCAVAVGVCLHLDDVPRCTSHQVQRATVKASPKRIAKDLPVPLPVPPPTPVAAATCGTDTVLPMPLRVTRKGRQKPSKRITLRLVTTAAGRTDDDTLKVRCVPNAGAGRCGPNPAGGPAELRLVTAGSGTDLDLGWTGNAQNFGIVPTASVRLCLAGCDATAMPRCTEREPETGAVNATTLGAPLPLLAADVPVCVVNRFGTPPVAGVTADVASGAVAGTITLASDLFRTSLTRVCPRCSTTTIGDIGVCDSGARQGRACVTATVVQVPDADGDPVYALSADCPPSGTALASLPLAIPVTTGVASLAGPLPCGAAQDDGCGGACGAVCTGTACVSVTNGQCADARGGTSQVCCATDSQRPCFPTAGGVPMVRLGDATSPTPPFGDPTYPKIGGVTLAGTFCVPGSTSALVDALVGLPGPGALVLPMAAAWLP